MKKFGLYLALIFGVLLPINGTLVFAQSESVDDVESILDRLEKRLLDQESDSLSFGEKSTNTLPPKKKGFETNYKYESQTIIGQTPEATQLKKISDLIAKLESDVDKLNSQVQATKQTILDQAAVDNYITIDAEMLDTETASIKSLLVKLDGYHVYELTDSSGLWLPSKMVPIYAGPLQPGAHRIDVEARLAIKHKQGLPLNSDVTRFVQKSFDMAVAGGTASNKYVITLEAPKTSQGKADAKMKEVL